MNIKNKKKKFLTIFLVVVLVLSFVTCGLGAYAMPLQTLSASKLYDVALTKTGIVANKDIVDNVVNQTINVLDGTAKSYWQWCEDNGKAKNATTWQEYLASDAYSTLGFRLSRWALVSADYIEYLITGQTLRDKLEEMLPKAITGSDGNNVTLDDDVVDDIRKEFDDYIKVNGDYYYLKTFGPDDINVLWFSDMNGYNNFKTFLKNTKYLHHVSFSNTNWNDYYFSLDSQNTFTGTHISISTPISERYWYYEIPLSTTTYTLGIYDESYFSCNFEKWLGKFMTEFIYTSDDDFFAVAKNETIGQPAVSSHINNTSARDFDLGVCSNDGRYIRVFTSENALKMFSVGYQPYYIANNANDYSNTDNSIKVNGDYLNQGSYTYSHDVIQQQIDNSETINEETVNNIVNEGSTTIINNYYGSSDSGNGSDDDNDDGTGGGLGSILDGLGSIVDALAEIIGFLLGVVGKVIGLIGDLFTIVFEGIKAVGAILGDFPKLLGEIFVFIPQELISFLVLAVEASVGIAIWRKFSKK